MSKCWKCLVCRFDFVSAWDQFLKLVLKGLCPSKRNFIVKLMVVSWHKCSNSSSCSPLGICSIRDLPSCSFGRFTSCRVFGFCLIKLRNRRGQMYLEAFGLEPIRRLLPNCPYALPPHCFLLRSEAGDAKAMV